MKRTEINADVGHTYKLNSELKWSKWASVSKKCSMAVKPPTNIVLSCDNNLLKCLRLGSCCRKMWPKSIFFVVADMRLRSFYFSCSVKNTKHMESDIFILIWATSKCGRKLKQVRCFAIRRQSEFDVILSMFVLCQSMFVMIWLWGESLQRFYITVDLWSRCENDIQLQR